MSPIKTALLIAALVLLGTFLGLWLRFLAAIHTTESGGLGAVSAGVSEAIVMALPAALVAGGTAFLVARRRRQRRQPGGGPEPASQARG